MLTQHDPQVIKNTDYGKLHYSPVYAKVYTTLVFVGIKV